MSNLLIVGKTFTYLIQVISLSWLMIDEEDLIDEEDSKKVFSQQDVTRRPRGKVEL